MYIYIYIHILIYIYSIKHYNKTPSRAAEVPLMVFPRGAGYSLTPNNRTRIRIGPLKSVP